MQDTTSSTAWCQLSMETVNRQCLTCQSYKADVFASMWSKQHLQAQGLILQSPQSVP